MSFTGNPCGYGNCMSDECEKCSNYKPTFFRMRVPTICVITKFFKQLFCKHDYEQTSWYDEYDKNYNLRYSVRMYRCVKCGKQIQVDGRFDHIIWKKIKERYEV